MRSSKLLAASSRAKYVWYNKVRKFLVKRQGMLSLYMSLDKDLPDIKKLGIALPDNKNLHSPFKAGILFRSLTRLSEEIAWMHPSTKTPSAYRQYTYLMNFLLDTRKKGKKFQTSELLLETRLQPKTTTRFSLFWLLVRLFWTRCREQVEKRRKKADARERRF